MEALWMSAGHVQDSFRMSTVRRLDECTTSACMNQPWSNTARLKGFNTATEAICVSDSQLAT